MLNLKQKTKDIKYRFGDDTQISLGSGNILVQIPIYKIITVEVDIVSANIPILIGLNLSDKYWMYVNSVSNHVCAPLLDLEVPMVPKRRHVYL